MNLPEIEKKWQKKWADTELYKFDKNSDKPKHYVLEMFSYPSGAKLHIGHWYNYSLSDSYARFRRMQGYNVFHPMGFDAFGLPAENYAIKTGIHPQDSTLSNIETMERQLKEMGASFDWDYEIKTCMPDYYKWTQWCFLQLYKKGLAYRQNAPVNWCPNCQTVLANEQVVDGRCERCGTEVVRKNLTQWFFKITDYADRLLEGLDRIDWPEKTKTMQKNWIGRSTGSEIKFKIKGGGEFSVFTTRADTLNGVSYVVFAPEHPLVDEITTDEYRQAVEDYKLFASKASEIDRLSVTREKTGTFTGAYAINPLNGEEVPIWISDYVLASYGTGAVMAVPAHDERDFEHAKKYGLPIKRVVKGKDGIDDTLPFCDYSGVICNSGEFDGLTVEEAKKAVTEKLAKTGDASFKVNYRLRDWLISRQRYWGAPIPMIHCPHCGVVPVPEDQLPVLLPYDVDFTPDGTSPLAKHEGFMNVKCPVCGHDAKRDPDTMDTFMCSSWYFLRYPDNKDDKMAWDPKIINKLLPVDKYIGGAEHACMHLLYARFFTKAFYDMGYLDFDEPFTSLVHQGTILGPDGEKMSKSRGNVVSPDTYISEYGSDAFRLYLAFGFSYVEGGPWSDGGIKSVAKYIDRVERLVDRIYKDHKEHFHDKNDIAKLDYSVNYAVKNVTKDIAVFQFNTAVARIMELTNNLYKYTESGKYDRDEAMSAVKTLLLLLSPFTPHFAEELWERIGEDYSIFNQKWPEVDESKLVLDEVEIPFQINGRLKERFKVSKDATKEDIEEYVRTNFSEYLDGKTIIKFIVVPSRIVNVVLK
ncbi:MAG: leucine--tRNA ligase [Christensenellaceae bacterium]|nr:leucine--tRNA ligase [Christensenellaceae bacterium]